jgi:hypothetical protein
VTNDLLISYDPSNGEVVGRVQKTSIEEINEKVRIAKKAQKLWSEFTIDERINYLEKCAKELSKRDGKDPGGSEEAPLETPGRGTEKSKSRPGGPLSCGKTGGRAGGHARISQHRQVVAAGGPDQSQAQGGGLPFYNHTAPGRDDAVPGYFNPAG